MVAASIGRLIFARQTRTKAENEEASHAHHAPPTRPAPAYRVRAFDPASLPRLRRARHAAIRLPRLPELRVVAMRVKGRSGGRADGRTTAGPELSLAPQYRPP